MLPFWKMSLRRAKESKLNEKGRGRVNATSSIPRDVNKKMSLWAKELL